MKTFSITDHMILNKIHNKYKNVKKKIINKLQSILGIDILHNTIIETHRFTSNLHDLVHIGVDVHFNEPHMILVYTKLNGGQIHHIPAHFDGIKELHDFVRHLKQEYATSKETWDVPHGMKHLFK